MLRIVHALRTELSLQRKLRRMFVTAAIIGPVALAPELSSACACADPLKTNPAQIASDTIVLSYPIPP